ncbi:hypothetical protein CCACVL1_02422 [Corchorus capsularis]|uniref:Uncharacterized protein n=1 Tax=Corchorus capsularis TaxID=210143 RepID=A0A1R3K8L3_COCAP|nr:hypothetical protein CCACVL1_02422 [Corchorus capsularis]
MEANEIESPQGRADDADDFSHIGKTGSNSVLFLASANSILLGYGFARQKEDQICYR